MVTAVIAFLVLGLVITLLLYVAIESETDNTEILDRNAAEEEAKQRGGIDPKKQFGKRNSRDAAQSDDAEGSDGWGNSTTRDSDWGESTTRDDWNDSTTRDDNW